MTETSGTNASAFPGYPIIAAMPSLPTKEDRLRFAFALLEEHGDKVGDYIYAAFRHASAPEEMVRWDVISEIIEDIIGRPLEMTYNAAERLASEGVKVEHKEGDDIVPQIPDRPFNSLGGCGSAH